MRGRAGWTPSPPSARPAASALPCNRPATAGPLRCCPSALPAAAPRPSRREARRLLLLFFIFLLLLLLLGWWQFPNRRDWIPAPASTVFRTSRRKKTAPKDRFPYFRMSAPNTAARPRAADSAAEALYCRAAASRARRLPTASAMASAFTGPCRAWGSASQARHTPSPRSPRAAL